MARTTAGLVMATLSGDYDSSASPDLTTFISSASLLVDQVAACALRKNFDPPVSDEFLADLEKWVTAHLYASTNSAGRPLQETKTLSSQDKFQGVTGMRFDSTYYGQTALSLDYTGCLRAITSGKRGRVLWLGRRPTEQTPYEDRR